MQVLGRGDFEVVGAFQREIDLGGPAEAGHHGGGVLPQEGVLRRAPAFARPEQVDQSVGLGVGVSAPQRIDADLTSQRDRVDRFVADRGDPHPGGEDRCHRIRFGRHVEDCERHLGHARSVPLSGRLGPPLARDAQRFSLASRPTTLLRSSMAPKNSSMYARTSWPPSKPRHSIRKPPDEFIAGVDRQQMAIGRLGVVVGHADQ